MATVHVTNWLRGKTATGDLSSYPFYLVKHDSTGTGVKLTAAATDKPCGVLMNEPTSGKPAEVACGGTLKVKLTGTCSAGDILGPSSTAGKAKVKDTDEDEYVAQANEAGVDGQLVECTWIGISYLGV